MVDEIPALYILPEVTQAPTLLTVHSVIGGDK